MVFGFCHGLCFNPCPSVMILSDIDHLFDDGACDFDPYEFALLNEELEQTTTDITKRRRGDPIPIKKNAPLKGDIRRFLPQLMLNVINTADFSSMLNFFDTFMEPDGRFMLEHSMESRYVRDGCGFCEMIGPELTAFINMGCSTIFPDMALRAKDVTISTNNVNSITKITMNCECNITKIYEVPMDWALAQLQEIYRANRPDPYRDLLFTRFKALNITALYPIKTEKPAKRVRKRSSKKNDESTRVLTPLPYIVPVSSARSLIPLIAPVQNVIPHTITAAIDSVADASYDREAKSAVNSTNSSGSPVSSSARLSDSSTSDNAAGTAPTRTGYDLSPLAHAVFSHVPRKATPLRVNVRTTYTIILDDTRIKSVYVTAVQPQ